MSRIRLGGISLDCADPEQLSAFWAELLGGEIVYVTKDVAVVKLDHLLITALRVEDHVAPTWPAGPVPKQEHIDVAVDDLDAAEGRATSLGAVRARSQPDPDSYRVFLDPAGHPFCLTTQIPDDWR